MIYITGDCHGDFRRLNTEIFTEQKEMTKNDTVIILGDFGGVWDSRGKSRSERYWLDWLDKKPFTTVFIDFLSFLHRIHTYIISFFHYKHWLFGHMHVNHSYYWEKSSCLYEQIIRIY